MNCQPQTGIMTYLQFLSLYVNSWYGSVIFTLKTDKKQTFWTKTWIPSPVCTRNEDVIDQGAIIQKLLVQSREKKFCVFACWNIVAF